MNKDVFRLMQKCPRCNVLAVDIRFAAQAGFWSELDLREIAELSFDTVAETAADPRDCENREFSICMGLAMMTHTAFEFPTFDDERIARFRKSETDHPPLFGDKLKMHFNTRGRVYMVTYETETAWSSRNGEDYPIDGTPSKRVVEDKPQQGSLFDLYQGGAR